jgi:hypothetical protein
MVVDDAVVVAVAAFEGCYVMIECTTGGQFQQHFPASFLY